MSFKRRSGQAAGRRQRPKEYSAEVHTVTIEKLVYEGWGLATQNGLKIFVPNSLPGDVVEIVLEQKRRQYAFGKIQHYVLSSPLRQKSPCAQFSICGGCQMIDVVYPDQLQIKEQIFADCLTQFFPALKPCVQPLISVPVPCYYRNKMEFSFGHDQAGVYLGLKKRGCFAEVVRLEHCFLLSALSDDIRQSCAAFFNAPEHVKSLPQPLVWQPQNSIGFLRHLMIRHSKSQDRYLLNLVVSADQREFLQKFTDYISQAFPQIQSVIVTINAERSDTTRGGYQLVLLGNARLEERLGHINYSISAGSFFQTNTAQAEKLYTQIARLAGLKATDTVLDLYCGTGSIGLFLAREVRQVIGIEENEQAVSDALLNQQKNQIENASFLAGDVKNILKFHQFQPDVIILDPPRSGMAPKAVQRTIDLRASKIIYVSCNPVTLLRDLQIFAAQGYQVEVLQPLDLFPNTYHLEIIARLVRVSVL